MPSSPTRVATSPTPQASSPNRHSFYEAAENNNNNNHNNNSNYWSGGGGMRSHDDSSGIMMDQLLAPSMDDYSRLTDNMDTTDDHDDHHDDNDNDDTRSVSLSTFSTATQDLTQRLERDMQAVRSAVKHGMAASSSSEEKKVDPDTYSSPRHHNHYNLSSPHSQSSAPHMDSSFDVALGEIGNEFVNEANENNENEEDAFDDAHQEETQSMQGGGSPSARAHLPSTSVNATKTSLSSPHYHNHHDNDDDDDNDGASSALDSPSPSSLAESRRYNDILGLLRNRRQELAAALQKQPTDVMNTNSGTTTTTSVNNDNYNDHDNQNDDYSDDSPRGDSSPRHTVSEIDVDTGENHHDDAVVEVLTKDTDDEDIAQLASIEEKPSDEQPHQEDDDKYAVQSENENGRNSSKQQQQLEKIESSPTINEKERRRQKQQQQALPSPSSPTRGQHHQDLHAISSTPPRSPTRSLPYFHKPSCVSPPASPPIFASNDLTRAHSDGSLSPKSRRVITAAVTAELSPKAHSDIYVGTLKSTLSPSRADLMPDLPALLGHTKPEKPQEQQQTTNNGNDGAAKPSPPTKRLTAENLAEGGFSTPPTGARPPSAPRSDPGDRGNLRAMTSTPRRRPQSPQSAVEVQTPSSDSNKNSLTQFGAPRTSPSKFMGVPRSSPPKARRGGGAGSPFRNGANLSTSPKKVIVPGKIRFRDPFPILRPEKQPRDPKQVIADYTVDKEQDPIRWVRPKPDLKHLIVAAMGSSLTRRSNACGAIKVLTTKNKKNQINLFRTDSFMSSLLFCAGQEIPARERDIALDARTRAVACIKAVCEPKINRYHAVTFPGLLDVLARVIQTDNGESRALACGALALIAKTSECREEIMKDLRLVKLLAQVLGNRVPVPSPVKEEKKVERAGSPQSHEGEHSDKEDHSDEESNEDHSRHTGRHGDESTIGDYDTAFAGSVGLLDASFDMLSHGDMATPTPPHFSDEEDKSRDGEDHEDAVSTVSTDSEPDQPVMDSIRKKNQERNQAFVQESRASACAVLLHLSRECALSPLLCNNHTILDNMILVANETSNKIHTRCLEFLFNLTRFQTNNARLTPYEGLMGTMLSLGKSEVDEDRLISLQVFQNLSADQASKSKMAIDAVLTFLTSCAVRKDDAEREAAVSTLQNISTEPGAVVAITNTKNAIATLVHLAHSPKTKRNTRELACETLANISLWLQTLAGTGKVPDGVENIPLPTLKTSGWDKWD